MAAEEKTTDADAHIRFVDDIGSTQAERGSPHLYTHTGQKKRQAREFSILWLRDGFSGTDDNFMR